MRRLILPPLALLGLATLGLASAGAFSTVHQANASAVGPIAKLSSTAITVGQKHRDRLSCRLTSFSPALGAFALGDRVRVACATGVLVAIADAPLLTKKTTNAGSDASGISGTVTALTTSTITVHDGDRTVTCTLGQGSPSVTGYPVGSHARISCVNGLLVDIGVPPGVTGTTTTGNTILTYAIGPITALSATSIVVQTMTCAIGAGSPATTVLAVGTVVRIACTNGVLVAFARAAGDPPATTTTQPTTTTTTTTTTTASTSAGTITGISGTITALSSTSITGVSAGGTDGPTTLTCTIGPSSPSTSGFAVGNSVRLYCQNGALYQLRHNDSPPTTTTTTTTTATTTTHI